MLFGVLFGLVVVVDSREWRNGKMKVMELDEDKNCRVSLLGQASVLGQMRQWPS